MKKLPRMIICLVLILMTFISPATLSVNAAANYEKIIYEYFLNEMKVNSAVACGVLANIEKESNFISTAGHIDVNGKISYGICQWNGSRFDDLKSFSTQRGMNYKSIYTQLAFLKYELEGKEKAAWNAIKIQSNTAEGAYQAGLLWASRFERCNEVYFTSRAVLARDTYWVKYVSKIPVSLTTASNVLSTGKPRIEWKAVSGALYYQVYRSDSENGKYTKIGSPTKTGQTDTKAVAGKKYYYKVRAVFAGDKYSVFSSKTVLLCLPSPPVASASVVKSTGKPRLVWNASDGAVKYQVYRATTQNGVFTRIGTPTALGQTDNKAVSGRTYYYKVRAVDRNGNYGAFSQIIPIKCISKADTETPEI